MAQSGKHLLEMQLALNVRCNLDSHVSVIIHLLCTHLICGLESLNEYILCGMSCTVRVLRKSVSDVDLPKTFFSAASALK